MRNAHFYRNALFAALAAASLGFGAVQAFAAPSAAGARGCPTTTCIDECTFGGVISPTTGKCICCIP